MTGEVLSRLLEAIVWMVIGGIVTAVALVFAGLALWNERRRGRW